MIAAITVFLFFHIAATNACATDNDCTVFEVCMNNVCVANNQGCNPPCVAPQVCVAPACFVPPAVATTTAAPGPATTTRPQTCPPNWTLFNNNCYIASVPGHFLFNQASDWCTQTGSRVVWFDQSTVSNFDGELNFINTFAIGRGINRYWIGLNRQFNQWVWTNGSPVTFSNWRPSQPDGCCGSNVTCAFVNYANFNAQWDDATCGDLFTSPQGFICKRPS